MSEIDELLEPDRTSQKNWFIKLPPEIRSLLCDVRKRLAENPTVSKALLHRRLREKYGDLIPKDGKRIAEFLRNDGRNYPDAEASDGAGQCQ